MIESRNSLESIVGSRNSRSTKIVADQDDPEWEKWDLRSTVLFSSTVECA
jgi:hypothetical protein